MPKLHAIEFAGARHCVGLGRPLTHESTCAVCRKLFSNRSTPPSMVIVRMKASSVPSGAPVMVNWSCQLAPPNARQQFLTYADVARDPKSACARAFAETEYRYPPKLLCSAS